MTSVNSLTGLERAGEQHRRDLRRLRLRQRAAWVLVKNHPELHGEFNGLLPADAHWHGGQDGEQQ